MLWLAGVQGELPVSGGGVDMMDKGKVGEELGKGEGRKTLIGIRNKQIATKI